MLPETAVHVSAEATRATITPAVETTYSACQSRVWVSENCSTLRIPGRGFVHLPVLFLWIFLNGLTLIVLLENPGNFSRFLARIHHLVRHTNLRGVRDACYSSRQPVQNTPLDFGRADLHLVDTSENQQIHFLDFMIFAKILVFRNVRALSENPRPS
jgi:hypothetical protein